MPGPLLSLIVPTRGRADSLARFLDSLVSTTADLSRIEVVLVVDEDDIPRADSRLPFLIVPGPPGRTMGALNADGYAASRGDFVMLLNDDVVVRTPGWDERALAAARHFLDGVVLVHVNDTLMRHHLCTFPLVSRSFCERAGGVCPREYLRYCIDDHVEDVFNLLAALGERRTIYLPEVVFEHRNAVERAGVREYHADPLILALDEPRFRASFPARKLLALDLLDRIAPHGPSRQSREAALAGITDPLALRKPNRQIVWSATPPPSRLRGVLIRAWRCWRERGVRGLVKAAVRRLAPHR